MKVRSFVFYVMFHSLEQTENKGISRNDDKKKRIFLELYLLCVRSMKEEVFFRTRVLHKFKRYGGSCGIL